jgi:predicted permease
VIGGAGGALLRAVRRIAGAVVPDSLWPLLDEEIREDVETRLRAGRGRLSTAVWASAQYTAAATRLGFATVTGALPRGARGLAPARIAADVRHGFRTLRRHPGFALTAIATLALGLGATTAIFSVVDGVLLRPLPYPDGDRIVRVGWNFGGGGGTVSALSPLQFRHVAENARQIDGLTTRRTISAALDDEPDGPIANGQRVSASFFRVMGATPVLGRAFTDEEAETGAPVVVLSDALWRDHFGGDPDVVGRTIPLDGEPHVVIGILREGFRLVDLPDADELFVPFRFAPGAEDERGANYDAIGRLADGATRESAAAELAVLNRTFRQAWPDRATEAETYRLEGYLSPFVDDQLRTALWGFLGAAGFVLFIACVNVISLFVARAQIREREFSLRAVLGAPATRLARQVLTESVVLATLAAIGGCLLAAASLKIFLSIIPADLPRADTIGIDLRVVAFTAAIAGLVAFVAGLPAALPAARARLLDALAGGRSGTQAGRRRAVGRRILIGGQVATSFVLLSAAAVLLASLWNLTGVDLGFRPEGLYSVELERARGAPSTAEPLDLRIERDLLPALESLPEIRSAALSANAPLERGLNMPVTLTREGEEISFSIELRAISPEYFATLPVPLAWGRAFDPSDVETSEPVAILNRALAERIGDTGRGAILNIGRFRGEQFCEDCPARRVVGVVDDVREVAPDVPARPTAYVPTRQAAGRFGRYGLPRILVRTEGAPPSIDALRAEVARLGGIRDIRVRQATELRAATIAVDRFNAALIGTFALVAVLITAVGLYGFLSYMVNLGRREAGVRLALGASRTSVVRRLTASGLGSVGAGLAAGVLLTLATSRLLASQVFGISAVDARVLVVTALALLAVATVASLAPARRAMRIDPAGLLRDD